jgi:DNA replication protein DnaC
MAKNNNRNQFGLIILGNSGVGKSFLANILLDREAFKHEFSARSVTHRTEYEEITFDNHRYAIFNIPGLIEADQVIKKLMRCHRYYVCIFSDPC